MTQIAKGTINYHLFSQPFPFYMDPYHSHYFNFSSCDYWVNHSSSSHNLKVLNICFKMSNIQGIKGNLGKNEEQETGEVELPVCFCLPLYSHYSNSAPSTQQRSLKTQVDSEATGSYGLSFHFHSCAFNSEILPCMGEMSSFPAFVHLAASSEGSGSV